MVRSSSSSHVPRVGVFAIVGTTPGSMRSITPAASRRRNTSSSDAASTAAAMVSAASPNATAGSGWTTARLSIQGSRDRTHTIRSGGTPFASNQMIPSVAVLPDPTITKLLGASTSSASSLTATTRTSAATPNGGGVVAGIVGARYAASTTLRRTSTRVVSPDTRDVTRWSSPSVWYSLPARKATRPVPTKRRYSRSS